ncbi:TTC39/IML2 family protein [Pontibacter mangrovi]|nr:DUF3808 domain-containing protein [Pontibacter mangrovi]
MLLLLALLHSAAVASPVFTARHNAVYQELLKLKVARGRTLLKPHLQQEPQNPINLLLANYADFLELCVQQDQQKYDALLEAQEKRLQTLEDLPVQEVWAKYGQAEVRLQVGLSKVLFGNRLSAAWDIRKAYLKYREIGEQHPNFTSYKKSLGVLQVLIGSVPDKYKWFLSIIGMQGSIKQGMENLRLAATANAPFNQEAELLHTVMLHMTAPDQERQALRQVEAIATRQPDNLLFQFAAMHLLKKTQSSEAALKTYLNRPKSQEYLSFPYLHHMAADLYLFRGEYAQSVRENRLFLQLHKGQHYLKAANYKLYLAYALNGHIPQAQWFLQQIPEVGLEETEEDRYAAKYALRQEPLVKPLMQARLHSDGGYYKEALQALGQLQVNKFTLKAVQAEYYYRKARILHGTDSLRQALPLYQKAIALCQGTDLYFAPSACLQSGYIYQELRQPDRARQYFKKALSYRQHEYKNSIDSKAKIALSDL